MDVKGLRRTIDRKIGERDSLAQELNQAQTKVKQIKRYQRRISKAQEVVRAVAQRTQRQLEYHIASVVANAQQSVFDDPYSMEAVFEQRRGRTECDLWFLRDGQRVQPLHAGLGAVDIAAFALRVASWSMARRRTRNTLLLDEPLRHLKGQAQNRRAIALMRQVSHELGLQIITISDERAPREDIMTGADQIIEVGKQNGTSLVRTIN